MINSFARMMTKNAYHWQINVTISTVVVTTKMNRDAMNPGPPNTQVGMMMEVGTCGIWTDINSTVADQARF